MTEKHCVTGDESSLSEITSQQLLSLSDELGNTLAQRASHRDAERILPFDAFGEIRRLRLGALRVPQKWGGAGGQWTDVAGQYLSLARGDANVAQAFLGHTVFVERLLLMGTPEQHAYFLPMAASGVIFSGAAAERGSGTRGELKTRLTRHGNHFIINGVKHYSTGALFGDWLKVRALNEENEMVSAIIPATRRGVIRHDDWYGLGQRTTASGTTELKNVHVNPTEVLLMEDWRKRRNHAGASAQIIHAAIDAGIALAALEEAVLFARQHIRPVSESKLSRGAEDPYVLHKIGEMSAHAHTAVAAVKHAALGLDTAATARFSGESEEVCQQLAGLASLDVAVAKTASTASSLSVSQWLFDIGGASATLRSRNLDRFWRNARTHTTHDPVAWKYQALGNYLINGELPPQTFSY